MPSATAGGANLSAYFKLDGSRNITGPSTLALAAGSFASDAFTIRGAAGQTGDLLVLQNSTPTDLVRWASDGRQIGNLTIDGSDLEDRYAVSRNLTVTGTITQVTGGGSIQTNLPSGQAALVHTGYVAAVVNAGRIDFGQGMTASYISTSASAQSRGVGMNVVAQHQGAGLMTALSGLLVTTLSNSPVTTHRGAHITATVTGSTAATLVGLDVSLTGTGSSATYGIRSNGDLIFAGSQKIIGGTGTTSDLTFQTTSDVGATGADMHFLVGNAGGTEAMTILNNGRIGIGTAAPTTALDIVGGVATQFRLGSSTADATIKNAYIQGRHYTNAEQDVAILHMASNGSANVLNIGGGSGSLNTVSSIGLYTAANAITLTGTARLTIDSAGDITFGDGTDFIFNTTTGTKIGTATTQKLSFFNATPIVRPVLATGAGATVDNVITVLQNLGLVGQT